MAQAVTSAEDLVEVVVSTLRTEMFHEVSTLWQTWTHLWDIDERKTRTTILKNHLTDLVKGNMDTIIQKENDTMQEYADRSERLIEEIEELKVQLGVEIEYLDVEKLPLHCMAKALNERASRYRQIRTDRLDRLKNLRHLEETLRAMLGTEPYPFENLPPVPEEGQLAEVADYTKSLQDLKASRTVEVQHKRKEVIELFAELGETPKLQFDMNVVMDDWTDVFQLTEDNMVALQGLLDRLTGKLNLAKERREAKVDRLKSLWAYLEEPLENQESFLQQNPGCTTRDFEALQLELERCNKEKHENIGKFVEKIRRAIEDEWERCLMGPEARSQFSAFKITTYSEDLYQLHENELGRLKDYFAINKNIFDLYTRHKTLFNKLIDLDGLGRSATRYQNRGGQLLQEERLRKTVAKDLPKVEEELKSALALYEMNNDSPFLCFDEPLTQVLDKQWVAHFDPRIIEKFRGGIKNARTPMASKRRAPVTSATTGGKMLRLAPRNNTQRNDANHTFSLEPTYDEFQKTLKGSKTVSRSTEVLSHNRNKKNLEKMRSTPNIASPMWNEPMSAPRTVPRATRRPQPSNTPQRVQTRGRLPFIL